MLPFKDLVAYINKHGGLAGHLIKGDYSTLSFSSPNAATAFQAACTHFVQDERDQLVVTSAEYGPTFETCLAQAHVVHFDASDYGQDLTGQDEFPYYLGPVTYGVDRYTAALIKTAAAQRWVTSGQKIGVIIEGCPEDLRTYKDVWTPLALQYGFQLTSVQIDCNTNGSLSQAISQIQSSVLKFRAEGVKDVAFLTAGDAIVAALFSTGAQSQGWYPQYLLSSLAEPARLEIPSALGMPRGQLMHVHGVGWVPITDVGSPAPRGSAQRSAYRLCQRMVPNDAGADSLNASARLDGISAVLMECDTMRIVEKILDADGDNLTLAGIRSVYAKVVDAFTPASNVSGRLHVSGSRTDGEDAVAPFAYNASCSCIRYTGPPRSFG